ncbi:MAG TPA: hypothetical protein PLB38_02970 [bacterium]|nr:hypothetical protein [bacterium]
MASWKRCVLEKNINVHGRKLKLGLLDKGKPTVFQKGDFLFYYPQWKKMEIFRLCEEDEMNYQLRQLKILGTGAKILDYLILFPDSYSAFVMAVAISMGFTLEEVPSSAESQIFRLI